MSDLPHVLFTTPRLAELLSGEARVRRLLDVEVALARAQARVGMVAQDAADEIARVASSATIDPNELFRDAVGTLTPIVPLLDRLRADLSDDAAAAVHLGATSQDIVDTATVLQVRDALDALDDELRRLGRACSRLADDHRDTPMMGRTLLQQALPIPFGAKAARWLAAVTRGTERLRDLRPRVLVIQLGGPVGTLAEMDPHGDEVAAALASDLDLGVPDQPWHAERDRIAELAGALATVAGTAGKIADDVVLLAQTEVGEVAEASPGGSSAMPHKRNPVAAITARAAARLAIDTVPTLLRASFAEHERAAGAWQAEWDALPRLLATTGCAVARVADALDGLEVDASAMRAHVDAGDAAAATGVVSAAQIDRALRRFRELDGGGA